MPEQFMISPAGFIAAINYGSGTPTFDVFRPLSGGHFVQTTGAHPITNLSGKQGTIEASILAGTGGSTRAVAFLVDRYPSPTKYIGILLDTNNLPFAKMSVDGLGTVIGQSLPSGTPLAAGSHINVRLAFNALAPISSGWTLSFQIDDVTQGVWVVDPVATWLPFRPAYLLVGTGVVSDMNGTVQHVQVSDAVEVAFRDVPPTAEELATGFIQANSLMAASMKVVLRGASAIVADSSVTATELTP